uniref:Zgc:162324 n=1 Tax=Echeneis naucrates TaxID=173247 RepID=A0A665UDL0_ECHNA
MFRNNYQGGAVVEVFSGQGKDPVAKWKLSGGPSAISKEYNKEVKGFVYCLEGSSQTVKMQMPQNGKMSLGLLQRFLVLQVNIPQCKDFSVELVITDSEHLKRRLHLSTVHKELSTTLFIKFIPLEMYVFWSTLCFDLVSFSGELFKGFLTLDGITLFATCKVRRIFTMKTEPTGMSDDDLIPRSYQFPPDVNHITQVLNMENLLKAVTRTGSFKSDCVIFLWVIVLKGEDNNKLKPVDSSHYNLPLLGSLKMHGDDDEELRMLASLKREQEEDECKGSGLSASQIHQCDVSISMSSDDTSTWTHISMVSHWNNIHSHLDLWPISISTLHL